MWINQDYYNELLAILQDCANGNFSFDESRLKKFNGPKYQKLTDALIGVKTVTKEHIESSIAILDGLIDGRFPKFNSQFEGNHNNSDFREIDIRCNIIAQKLESFKEIIKELQCEIIDNGEINSRARTNKLSGEWLNYIDDVNSIIDYFAKNFDEITQVVSNVAHGDLSQKIKVNGRGEVLELKETINTMVDQLSQFASEVTRVAKEVGTDGLLGGQARVEGVSGTWLDLTNNVNNMAESLTAQVRNIADVTTAVAKGDLSQKITVDARGEVYELKQTINTMVDQLSQFASEVTRVAKEVGTDGLLGGQARVEGVSGTWLDLTNNVNNMAESLTAQVRNIADVTTAVAKGDLSQKITVNAKGEVLELKETINTMVDQLSQFASEVSRVAKEVGTDGLLGGQARVEGVSGTWLDLTNNVNNMAESLTAQVRNIADVTTAVAKGDLSQKITVDAKGEVYELKQTINTMVDQLSQFASEVTRVAKEVGTDGLLGGQARVEGVSGTWLDLTNNVNNMAESLTAQVRNISNVTTAVAKGNLSQKITVDAKGEVYELKQTINTMVDQLSQFAAEVTRVTKEVGTDGLLGGQARVEGVSGAWLDLTNNINIMSASLAKVDIENKSQIWIKDGISILSKEILYKDILTEQFRIAIHHLSRYINAGMGVIYIHNFSEKTLSLEASYAYTKSADIPTVFEIGEGVVGQVGYDKAPILIKAETAELAIKTGTTQYKVLSTYTSPMIFKDKLVGVVEVASYSSFTPLQLEYVEAALSVLAGSFYASLQVRDKKKLQEISIRDALTGLYNRGHFEDVVPQIINYEKRKDGLICFAMLDIDYFKKFNDDYGHKVGDEVLKKVANVLKTSASRKEDLCFRLGGEEFSIIFSARSKQKAYDFMCTIKDSVEALEL